MRDLVNAYEVEAGIRCSLQVTLYDPYLSASEVVFQEEALYQVYLSLLMSSLLCCAHLLCSIAYSCPVCLGLVCF